MALRRPHLYSWYRAQLRERIPRDGRQVGIPDRRHVGRLAHPAHKMRGATCNPDAGRIWLNAELAKKLVACLEYVVVHEMVHLIERKHNERCWSILDREMPR